MGHVSLHLILHFHSDFLFIPYLFLCSDENIEHDEMTTMDQILEVNRSK